MSCFYQIVFHTFHTPKNRDIIPREQLSQDSNKTIVTFISRKPYTRWKGDNAEKNFHRILENEDKLVEALQSVKQDLNLHIDVVHFETMEICKQIEKSALSDILIGVHGAGLVHLWWLMKRHATVIELEPHSQKGNPTFRKVKKKLLGELFTP